MLKRPLCLVCLLLMGILWGIRMGGGEDLFLRPAAFGAAIPEGETVQVFGELRGTGETESGYRLHLIGARLKEEKRAIGDLYVYTKEDPGLLPGTTVTVSGKLTRIEEAGNPGEFDTAWFYACDRIYYQMFKGRIMDHSIEYSRFRAWVARFRERLSGIFSERGEEGAVLAAMLLGDKSGLSGETKLRYQMAGIIAILAISGLHISVIGMGLNKLLEKAGLPPVPAFLISLGLLIFYLILTGESVSAIRAVSMFMLNRMAFFLGRSYDLYTGLAVPAIWILLQAPACLFSGGFLLSFAAVIGIAAVAPALEQLFSIPERIRKERGIRGWIREKALLMLKGGVLSAAVVLAVMPVSLRFYGEVSVIGILVNMLLLPTVGVVMGSGILGVSLNLAGFPEASNLAFGPAEEILKLYDRICALAVRIPGGVQIFGSPSLYRCLFFYVFLFLFCFSEGKGEERLLREFVKKAEAYGISFRFPTSGQLRKGGKILLLCLCLLLMGFHPRRELEMTLLDVGQGDGIVIRTPSSAVFMIDGGSSTETEAGRYRILPFLKHEGIRRIDGVFVTHTDLDHYSGIREILEMIRDRQTVLTIDKVFLPDWREPGKEWEELAELAEEAGADVVRLHRGDRLQTGETELDCIWPPAGMNVRDLNESCIVLKLKFGSFDALLTGDAGLETESRLADDLTETDVLKVGHHGSLGSTGEELLERCRPVYSVVSCARFNTYGHPAPETVRRLCRSGTKILYTMESGAILFRTDGKRLQVQGYRRAVDKAPGNG